MPDKKRKFTKEGLEKKRQVMLANRAKRNPDTVADDPKKQDFLKRYYDPNSETYSNAYQSAIAAGYSHSYAKVITAPGTENKWVNITNYIDSSNMTPQHIIKSFERMALRGNKEETQLKALEFLAKINGMLVEKKVTTNINIDNFLNDDDKHREIIDL